MLLALNGCTKAWRSEAIDGRVVDEGTDAPIAGAIVLVNWQIKGMEGYPQGQLGIFERVTDAAGRFQIPAWGPKRPPMGTTVDASDPTVRVFKNGYEPLVVRRPPNSKDSAHVEMLRLRRFEGTAESYASQMDEFWRPLNVNFVIGRCEWSLAAQMIHALVRLRGEFDRAGIRSDLPLESGLCNAETH
ncbi:carboxypeptidase-like regulatory domain-containing protein [Steroidobacter flavus]|uniref:Carboxypeptidase-like regulatory domain-containing protein n=1 Tax=Steroidobacter flavus TaxID=1842136 RepID=A0ABV8T1K8_9GAMM